MNNTFEQLVDSVQADMNINDTSPMFPLTRVKNALNRAYAKCAGLFRWPGTEDAKRTTTQLNQEYYDYPSDWRDDSIWRIEVNGDQYGEDPDGSPLGFEDYLVWRADDDNANSTDKKWANQKRRYFIYPVPTSAGLNIDVWGQRVVDELVADGATTIFSYSMPECNEAIILEAEGILKSQGQEENAGQFRSTEAKQILVVAWNKIRQEQGKYERNQSFFNVPDYFSGKSSVDKVIGNF